MKMYDAISRSVSRTLKDTKFEILEVSSVEKVDAETGEIKRFLKFSVEVPRSAGTIFARCRFPIKVPVPHSCDLPVTENDLEEREYFVSFNNLKISFISSAKEVYFSADSYYICDIGAEVDADHY